jgi:molybdopterin-guanine dinucleotide biosynthesis protein A
MISSFCVIGISGYSGSGKTTLIEKIVQGLKKEGLYIGLLKHASHHGLSLDGEGKDSERFYRAGADFVFAHDLQQGFARFPLKDAGLSEVLARFPKGLDIVLVEGHKSSDIPGIWILPGGRRTQKQEVPAGVSRRVIFRDDPKYVEKVMAHIHREVGRFHSKRTLTAGLLVGGRSRRMGTSKALLKIREETLLERSFKTLGKIAARTLFLGSAELPRHLCGADRLTDAAGVEGPMAGILSAFRWAPESTWIISAVDMPFMDKEAWEWVLGHRRPGVWAVLPLLKSGAKAETMAACYEPMIFAEVEALARNGIRTLQKLTTHPKVITPLVPESLSYAWKNVNTSKEWIEARALMEDISPGDCAE